MKPDCRHVIRGLPLELAMTPGAAALAKSNPRVLANAITPFRFCETRSHHALPKEHKISVNNYEKSI